MDSYGAKPTVDSYSILTRANRRLDPLSRPSFLQTG